VYGNALVHCRAAEHTSLQACAHTQPVTFRPSPLVQFMSSVPSSSKHDSLLAEVEPAAYSLTKGNMSAGMKPAEAAGGGAEGDRVGQRASHDRGATA